MYSSITIDNFRGFEHFKLTGLGRVNLLVGQNNSGKSSILEAVHLLATGGNPVVVWALAQARGEYFSDTDKGREIDPSHMFNGHRLKLNEAFSIAGESVETIDSLDVRLIRLDSQQPTLFQDEDLESEGSSLSATDVSPDDLGRRYALEFTSNLNSYKANNWTLSRLGGLGTDNLRRPPRFDLPNPKPVRFVSTHGQSIDQIVTLFEEFVLTPYESLALDALKVIEPSLERVATRSSDLKRSSTPGAKGGVLLKFKGQDFPVPIGSMGDGMWRLLGMALALAAARGGILLVDEIDTGLHYTTMDLMWRLIDSAARELSVQVFATTHSRDCVESLAVIATEAETLTQDATIHRVERDREQSVAFAGAEIIAAAKRGIEVR